MKKILLVFCSMAICMTVHATNIENEIKENGFYTNKEGILINKENYEKVKDFMNDEEIESINYRLYEIINDSEKVVGFASAIIETKSINIGNTHMPIEENIITLEELNAKLRQIETRASTQLTTEYKQIWLMTNLNNGKYNFYIQNTWKKTPYYKSFDVLGFRWEGNVTADPTSAKGTQSYKQFSGEVNPPTINYSSTSGNFKYAYNGVGLSQNLVDDANIFVNELYVNTVCTGNVTLYATYQHAQGDISLKESQNYTFEARGLGSVLSYNDSSIKNIYDNTPGLKISFTC